MSGAAYSGIRNHRRELVGEITAKSPGGWQLCVEETLRWATNAILEGLKRRAKQA